MWMWTGQGPRPHMESMDDHVLAISWRHSKYERPIYESVEKGALHACNSHTFRLSDRPTAFVTRTTMSSLDGRRMTFPFPALYCFVPVPMASATASLYASMRPEAIFVSVYIATKFGTLARTWSQSRSQSQGHCHSIITRKKKHHR